MQQSRNPIRVVLGKVGCDIHEGGAFTLIQAFIDAGMEVVYTGRYQSPEAVVSTAVQEGADIIALSDHTGGMKYIATEIVKLLKEKDAANISVIAGGLIPPRDIPALEKLGVTGNYGPGTSLDVIVNHIISVVNHKEQNPSHKPMQIKASSSKTNEHRLKTSKKRKVSSKVNKTHTRK